MRTMKYLVLFFLHNVLLQMANCIMFRKKWLRWNEINVTFGETIDSIESVSFMMCLAKCQEISGCEAAYVNESNSKCELSTYYPPDGTKSATPRTGWAVYYKESYEVKGVQAWQSSTFADCVAENAIDGKFDELVCSTSIHCGCRCAHTNSQTSAWVVELKSPGYVKTVLPYFRVESAHSVWRNKNFYIFVHNSFEDAKNGLNGTLCLYYPGNWEPITTPITLACLQAVYGKAVRIYKESHTTAIDAIQICEILIHINCNLKSKRRNK